VYVYVYVYDAGVVVVTVIEQLLPLAAGVSGHQSRQYAEFSRRLGRLRRHRLGGERYKAMNEKVVLAGEGKECLEAGMGGHGRRSVPGEVASEGSEGRGSYSACGVEESRHR
ncbi:MAG TPA: hypothetical protein DFR83_29680, partial [Deltaproteobacteria bacterium]|nr:hypothetical protein [Deltaproteobacteria bacterium]